MNYYIENELIWFKLLQAHQLNTMLDQQEQAIRQNTGGGGYDSPHDGAASHGGATHRDYDSTGMHANIYYTLPYKKYFTFIIRILV